MFKLSFLKSNRNAGIGETKSRRESSSIQSISKLGGRACTTCSNERYLKYKSNINVKPLKVFVSEHLPPGSVLRETILHLNDRIDMPSFLLWIPIWLELARVQPNK